MSFLKKYKVICRQKKYWQVCHAIPSALSQLIYNFFLYSEIKAVLLNLKNGNCNLNDSKGDNEVISATFISLLFHEYHSGKYLQFLNGDTQPIMSKAYSKFVKWLVSPVSQLAITLGKQYPISFISL